MNIDLKARIAAMDVQYLQYSLDYIIDSYNKCELKNMEFWAGEPHYYRMDYKTQHEAYQRLKGIREKLNNNGIKVIMYTPETLNYPYSFSHPDQTVRRRTIEFFEMCCEDALSLGCQCIFINTGCGLRDINREESWKRVVSSFNEICSIGEKYNIDFVLEQLQPYESNLVTTLDDTCRMIREVNKENLKVCLDVVAMEAAGEKINQWFSKLKKQIVHIHLADTNHQVLGTGNYDIKSYLDYLKRIDFTGYVSLEINDSIYWTNPHLSLLKSVEFLNDYFSNEFDENEH